MRKTYFVFFLRVGNFLNGRLLIDVVTLDPSDLSLGNLPIIAVSSNTEYYIP